MMLLKCPGRTETTQRLGSAKTEVAQASGLEGLTFVTEPWLWVVLAVSPNQTASLRPQGPCSQCSSCGVSSSNSLLTWLDATLLYHLEYVKVRLYPIVFGTTVLFNLNCVCFLVVTSLMY